MSLVVQDFGFRDAEILPSVGRSHPKSAKARNRGVRGTEGAAGAMGIWRRREYWGSWVDDRIALARVLGVRAGANERIARCSTGLRCDHGTILLIGASRCVAEREPARMARFGAVLDRR